MARKRKLTDTVNLRLRLPEGLRDALATEAEKASRSLNSEILWRLGQTFGEQWQRFIAGIEERERRDQELIERVSQSPEVKALIASLIARRSETPKKREEEP